MFVLFAATTLLAFAFAALSPLLRHAPVILALTVDWGPVASAAITALAGLIATIGTILGALVAQWLRSKLRSEKAREMFDLVLRHVQTEVRALMQSTLPEIRARVLEATADGKITPEEAAKLRALVIDRVRLTLGPAALATLRTLLGDRDIDSYLASVIESEVLRAKTDAPRSLEVAAISSPSTPPAPASAADATAPNALVETITPPPLSTASGEVLR